VGCVAVFPTQLEMKYYSHTSNSGKEVVDDAWTFLTQQLYQTALQIGVKFLLGKVPNNKIILQSMGVAL